MVCSTPGFPVHHRFPELWQCAMVNFRYKLDWAMGYSDIWLNIKNKKADIPLSKREFFPGCFWTGTFAFFFLLLVSDWNIGSFRVPNWLDFRLKLRCQLFWFSGLWIWTGTKPLVPWLSSLPSHPDNLGTLNHIQVHICLYLLQRYCKFSSRPLQ